ncbi:hypothetical protein GIB67_039697, partial [Kingdonia uniflora]
MVQVLVDHVPIVPRECDGVLLRVAVAGGEAGGGRGWCYRDEVEAKWWLGEVVLAGSDGMSEAYCRRGRVFDGVWWSTNMDHREEEEEERGEETGVEYLRNVRGEGEDEESINSEEIEDEDTCVGEASPQEKAWLERFMAKHQLEGKGIILVSLGSEYTFKDESNEGIMAFRGNIRLGMRLPLWRLVKEECEVNSALKKFIHGLGYNPETFELYTPEEDDPSIGDVVHIGGTESRPEVEVAGIENMEATPLRENPGYVMLTKVDGSFLDPSVFIFLTEDFTNGVAGDDTYMVYFEVRFELLRGVDEGAVSVGEVKEFARERYNDYYGFTSFMGISVGKGSVHAIKDFDLARFIEEMLGEVLKHFCLRNLELEDVGLRVSVKVFIDFRGMEVGRQLISEELWADWIIEPTPQIWSRACTDANGSIDFLAELLLGELRVSADDPHTQGVAGLLRFSFVGVGASVVVIIAAIVCKGVPKLKRVELQIACEDFSNIICSSLDGTIYKRTLSSGVEIAVASTAVLSAHDWSTQLEAHFRKKIETLSNVNHKNFMNLLDLCEEEEHFTRMMVSSMLQMEHSLSICTVLLRMLPKYHDHVHTYENTLIAKFFGLHRIKPSSSQKVEIDENTILKDLDLKDCFNLEPSWQTDQLKKIEIDSEFLESQCIMHYNILLYSLLSSSSFKIAISSVKYINRWIGGSCRRRWRGKLSVLSDPAEKDISISYELAQELGRGRWPRIFFEEEFVGIKESFQLMDVNNNGKITLGELKVGLGKIGHNIPDVDHQMLMEAADVDGNGTLDFEEYVAVAIHLRKIENDEYLHKAFEFFDKKKSGYIEIEELRDALADKVDTNNEEVITAIIHDVDTKKVSHSHRLYDGHREKDSKVHAESDADSGGSLKVEPEKEGKSEEDVSQDVSEEGSDDESEEEEKYEMKKMRSYPDEIPDIFMLDSSHGRA